ncbi:conserved Plasmodium protein, unknown function [Plasmodium gallinaceum]|uniref:FAD-binding domain-containing protein n=1 Tax=Plasmodium gallinaceum TaxID=5849 RepID=A0A1J1GLI8_PLAGA|nr:conserved Plasmodium protein, unknown function [Plasmodium gallinaceum]CRG93233.1 conserved Plasmodium protein, unknown function [Plasmodium gallinaceum]
MSICNKKIIEENEMNKNKNKDYIFNNMEKVPRETDVLIVGASTGGLFLSLDLMRKNIKNIIINSHECSSVNDKINEQYLLYPRTLEILQDLNLLTEIASKSLKLNGISFYIENKLINKTSKTFFQNFNSTLPYMLSISKFTLNNILRKNLEYFGEIVEDSTILWNINDKLEGNKNKENYKNKNLIIHNNSILSQDLLNSSSISNNSNNIYENKNTRTVKKLYTLPSLLKNRTDINSNVDEKINHNLKENNKSKNLIYNNKKKEYINYSYSESNDNSISSSSLTSNNSDTISSLSSETTSSSISAEYNNDYKNSKCGNDSNDTNKISIKNNSSDKIEQTNNQLHLLNILLDKNKYVNKNGRMNIYCDNVENSTTLYNKNESLKKNKDKNYNYTVVQVKEQNSPSNEKGCSQFASIKSKFIVGTDGRKSIVRKFADVKMDEKDNRYLEYISVDICAKWGSEMNHYNLSLIASQHGFITCFPIFFEIQNINENNFYCKDENFINVIKKIKTEYNLGIKESNLNDLNKSNLKNVFSNYYSLSNSEGYSSNISSADKVKYEKKGQNTSCNKNMNIINNNNNNKSFPHNVRNESIFLKTENFPKKSSKVSNSYNNTSVNIQTSIINEEQKNNNFKKILDYFNNKDRKNTKFINKYVEEKNIEQLENSRYNTFNKNNPKYSSNISSYKKIVLDLNSCSIENTNKIVPFDKINSLLEQKKDSKTLNGSLKIEQHINANQNNAKMKNSKNELETIKDKEYESNMKTIPLLSTSDKFNVDDFFNNSSENNLNNNSINHEQIFYNKGNNKSSNNDYCKNINNFNNSGCNDNNDSNNNSNTNNNTDINNIEAYNNSDTNNNIDINNNSDTYDINTENNNNNNINNDIDNSDNNNYNINSEINNDNTVIKNNHNIKIKNNDKNSNTSNNDNYESNYIRKSSTEVSFIDAISNNSKYEMKSDKFFYTGKSNYNWHLTICRNLKKSKNKFHDINKSNEYKYLEVIKLIKKIIPNTELFYLYNLKIGIHKDKICKNYYHNSIILAGESNCFYNPLFSLSVNLTIHDTYNIGWRLKSLIDYNCSSLLLESYEKERKLISEKILSWNREKLNLLLNNYSIYLSILNCCVSTFANISTFYNFFEKFYLKTFMLQENYYTPDIINNATFLCKKGFFCRDRAKNCILKYIYSNNNYEEKTISLYDYLRDHLHTLILCINISDTSSHNYVNSFSLKNKKNMNYDKTSLDKLIKIGRLTYNTMVKNLNNSSLKILWIICDKNKNEINQNNNNLFSTKLSSSKSININFYKVPNELLNEIKNSKIQNQIILYDFINDFQKQFNLKLNLPHNIIESYNFKSAMYIFIRPDLHITHMNYVNDENKMTDFLDYIYKFYG